MRRNAAVIAGLTTALVAIVSVASCQTYDFEPVVPLAISQYSNPITITSVGVKPNLMIVLDKSGSMNKPVDPTNANCPSGCGVSTLCPANCPTRISDLRAAMATFLNNSGKSARMGLVEFPNPNTASDTSGCIAPTVTNDVKVQIPTVDDDAVLEKAAGDINAEIQSINPSGGTPTAFALQNMTSYAGLHDTANGRKNFFLLLTDGEPNCNPTNPNTCANASACKCTLSTCDITSPDYCHLGCLDQDNTASVIQSAYNNGDGIGTIVVGFGSDTAAGGGTGYAAPALTQMALAGGYPRTCPNGTDAECGTGDTCNKAVLTAEGVPTCNQPYYQAKNGTELAAALAKISEVVKAHDPCIFPLGDTVPSDPSLVSVVVDGQAVPAGSDTWNYDVPSNTVTLVGALCTKSTNSTNITVEVRVLKTL